MEGSAKLDHNVHKAFKQCVSETLRTEGTVRVSSCGFDWRSIVGQWQGKHGSPQSMNDKADLIALILDSGYGIWRGWQECSDATHGSRHFCGQIWSQVTWLAMPITSWWVIFLCVRTPEDSYRKVVKFEQITPFRKKVDHRVQSNGMATPPTSSLRSIPGERFLSRLFRSIRRPSQSTTFHPQTCAQGLASEAQVAPEDKARVKLPLANPNNIMCRYVPDQPGVSNWSTSSFHSLLKQL